MPAQVTRRELLQLAACAGICWRTMPSIHAAQKQRSTDDALDHLMLGVADLDAGIMWLEQRTGIRPVIGGTHPGRGTRNALIALKGRQYVELIAPDPAQSPDLTPHLKPLTEPRLIGWAAGTSEIEALVKRMKQMQHEPTALRPGSRARPDGRTLKWTTVGVASKFAANGVDPIPFFIQWDAASAHPSTDSPKGCALASLEFEHPNADDLSDALGRLEIAAVVRQAPAAAIVATLNTPKGTVILR